MQSREAATSPTVARPREIDHIARCLIRRKARDLCRQRGFRPDESDDFEQDLQLLLFRRLPKFDPAIGHYIAFIHTVVSRQLHTIYTKRRSPSGTFANEIWSLDHPIRDTDGRKIPIAQTIASSNRLPVQRPPQEIVDLQSDVSTLMERLTPLQQEICKGLMAASALQVARDLGITRSRMATQIQHIRSLFEKHGMKEYF